MHNAPSVTYPVGRSLFGGMLAGLLWLGGLAALILWLLQAGAATWRQGLAVGCVLGMGLIAARGWRSSPEGELAWTGEQWLWIRQGTQVEGVVSVHLDVQRNLLVHFRPPSGESRWLWLERVRAPQRWESLRRAIHAPARQAQSASPQPL